MATEPMKPLPPDFPDLAALEALCAYGIQRGVIKLERTPNKTPGLDNKVTLKFKWLGVWIPLCWLYEDPYEPIEQDNWEDH
jgi:hypothetical protein